MQNKFELFDDNINEPKQKIENKTDKFGDLKELMDECQKIINSPDLIMTSDIVTKRYLIKMSAWGEYLSKLAGEAEADYRTAFAQKYLYFKSIGEGTIEDAKQNAEASIITERQNREILTRVYDSVINMVHSIRVLVK